jgi:hypothetical protein
MLVNAFPVSQAPVSEVQLDNGYLSNGLSQNKVHQSEIKPNGNGVVPFAPVVPPSLPQLDDKAPLGGYPVSLNPNVVHSFDEKSYVTRDEYDSLDKQIKELQLKHQEKESKSESKSECVYKCEYDADNKPIVIDPLADPKEQNVKNNSDLFDGKKLNKALSV